MLSSPQLEEKEASCDDDEPIGIVLASLEEYLAGLLVFSHVASPKRNGEKDACTAELGCRICFKCMRVAYMTTLWPFMESAKRRAEIPKA